MTAPRLTIAGARKRFGGVHALRGVDLEVAAGEVHALLGENGAGKSTLMKVLSGAVRPDEGRMTLDGAPFAPTGPRDARRSGVAMIYQELNLCADLTVLENVTLGEETARAGVVQSAGQRARLFEVLAGLGVAEFGPDTPVRDLGPGDRQLVEIARALMADARVVVFDEPTSSLSPPEVERLFGVVRDLASRGVTAIWISHFLNEVEAVCDRFTILRDGESAGGGAVAESTPEEWVALMSRRAGAAQAARAPRSSAGPAALELEELSGSDGVPDRVTLGLHEGEVLGLFGLVGAGRTELLRAIFGLDPVRSGAVRHLDHHGPPLSPRRWLARGVGLLSEDRALEGLHLDLSLAENVTASSPRPIGRQAEAFERWRAELGVRAGASSDAARTLSGGNQQKLAIARLLHHDVRVLLLDEPTRGIDVGAKEEIYALLDRLRGEGRAVLVVSSYVPELLRVCDRVGVMHRGRLAEIRPTAAWDEESLIAAASGATPAEVLHG